MQNLDRLLHVQNSLLQAEKTKDFRLLAGWTPRTSMLGQNKELILKEIEYEFKHGCQAAFFGFIGELVFRTLEVEERELFSAVSEFSAKTGCPVFLSVASELLEAFVQVADRGARYVLLLRSFQDAIKVSALPNVFPCFTLHNHGVADGGKAWDMDKTEFS